MKYSKEYVILNRDHWTGSDVIHVIEQGVVAMLVVMLATWLVLYPLHISCANSIDVTGDTSSSSVESDFICKANKWNEIKDWTCNHHIQAKKADSAGIRSIMTKYWQLLGDYFYHASHSLFKCTGKAEVCKKLQRLPAVLV